MSTTESHDSDIRNCFVCGSDSDTKPEPYGSHKGQWRCVDFDACLQRAVGL